MAQAGTEVANMAGSWEDEVVMAVGATTVATQAEGSVA